MTHSHRDLLGGPDPVLLPASPEADAALTVGWWAATSAGGLPAASSASASGFGGRRVAGGSPSRLP